ncbi:MAG TPA: hypothetical protein VHF05_01740 [Candidatus Paceibacterota bacterium]|nr:hypothetical protein [Candidatus Paceibacterota bacterium]
MFVFPLGILQPKQAQAQWAVFDIPTEIETTISAFNQFSLVMKEYVGDSVAWFIAKVIIQQMTASVVDWINNGFNGNPAFVQNPQQYFTNIGDAIAGNFILNDPSLNFLCSSFGPQLRIGLNNQRMLPFQNSITCTLTNVIQNIDAFTQNFNNGGWLAWNTMVTEPQNNPYGAYLMLTNEYTRRRDQIENSQKLQLDWGKGFLSFTDANGVIQTPGSVIETQLNQHLSSGLQSLVGADEINEIIGALMTQLVTKTLSSVSGGLRGLGTASGLNDGGASLQQMQNIQIPSQGTCTGATGGQINPDLSISGGTGSACSSPDANSYLPGFGLPPGSISQTPPPPPATPPITTPPPAPTEEPTTTPTTTPTTPPPPPATPPTTPPPSNPGGFKVGDTIQAMLATSVRVAANVGAQEISVAAVGDKGTLLEQGPFAGGSAVYWWRIRWANGIEGWSMGSTLGYPIN